MRPKLTELPPELLERIARTLRTRNAAVMASASRNTRAGVAPVLAARRQRHAAWEDVLRPLALAMRDATMAQLGQLFAGDVGSTAQLWGQTWRRQSAATARSGTASGPPPERRQLYLDISRFGSVGPRMYVMTLRMSDGARALAKRYVSAEGSLTVRSDEHTYADRGMASVLRAAGLEAPQVDIHAAA